MNRTPVTLWKIHPDEALSFPVFDRTMPSESRRLPSLGRDYFMSKISIGMPVYNGESFVGSAIDSILAQTFSDFRLTILDNASTDRTGEICRTYADRDARVTYLRNEANIGAPRNFNKVFALSEGEYFKWAAADDLLGPAYLERCIGVLEEDSRIVLCHSDVARINESGQVSGAYIRPLVARENGSAVGRFADMALAPHACFDIFGIIRRETLARTRLIGGYLSADRVLLAELALLGLIHIVPETLFYSREHAERSVRIPVQQRVREWWAMDGVSQRFVFPYWRVLQEYIHAVNRSAGSRRDKLACYQVVSRWAFRYRRHLGSDLREATRVYVGR
jgi:glycosyltransferase involved in cell wall biosynthesis